MAVKKITFSLLFLFLGSVLFAQNYTLQSAFDFYRLHKQTEMAANPVLSESDIEGSPYENKDFREGYLVTTSSQQFMGLQLRYNIYNDQIEYKDESGQSMAFAHSEVINHVMIGDAKYIFSPYAVLKKIEKSFFLVSEEGKASLYIRKKIFFQEAQPAAAYKDPEPPKFLNKPDEYYIRVEPAEAKKVGARKELASLFPDKQSELEEFIKKNKTRTNDLQDLTDLVKFYNSLN